MKKICFLFFLSLSFFVWPSTVGHEHDLEREGVIRSLFSIAWPYTMGVYKASILTATSPVSLLVWAEGAAIIIDAKEFVSAGLNLYKRPPKGLLFDVHNHQIVVTSHDLRTLVSQEEFRYKDAIWVDFMLLHSDLIYYDAVEQKISINVGSAYANLPIRIGEHNDSDLIHTEDFLLGRQFWKAREPLKPNQNDRLGKKKSQLCLQVVIDAKPLVKAGLKPSQLHNMRYEIESYGLFGLLKRQRIIVDFYC